MPHHKGKAINGYLLPAKGVFDGVGRFRGKCSVCNNMTNGADSGNGVFCKAILCLSYIPGGQSRFQLNGMQIGYIEASLRLTPTWSMSWDD